MLLGDVNKMHRKLDFKIQNFQIDNMTLRSFPVIVGPKKPFNYRESKYRRIIIWQRWWRGTTSISIWI